MNWLTVLGPALWISLPASAQEPPQPPPNRPPSVGDVALGPVGAKTTDALTCTTGTPSDPDGDPVTLKFTWSMDGKAMSATGAKLGADQTKRDRSFVCTATPYDGKVDGVSASSAALTILNTAPVASGVTVTPAAPSVDQDLTCNVAKSSDVDGDPVTLAWSWSADGAPIAGQTGKTLPKGAFSKNQKIACTTTPTDGGLASEALADGGLASEALADGGLSGEPVTSEPVVVKNTAPVLASVAIAPERPVTTDAITCTVGPATDADGDVVSFAYRWLAAGAPIQGQTGVALPADATKKGQSIACEVTPSDGQDTGRVVKSASVTVQNTPPTLTSASIEGEAKAGGTLTCKAGNASDVDGDTVTFGYAWTVDGKAVGTSQTLSSSSFKKGQEVACAVTPKDGASSGAPVTASAVKVVNTPPTLDAASATPAEPTADKDVTCRPGTSKDADADKVTLAYAWTVDGAPAGSEAVLPAGKFKKNQALVCTVTPSDGEVSGAPVAAASVRSKNTVPVLASVAISPEKPATDDTITCAPGEAKDADGDAVTSTYAWTVNGSVVAGQTGATLSGQHFAKGQAVACAVTPGDGEGAGAPVKSPSVTVQNTPPKMAAASIEGEAKAGGTLTCKPGEASDLDGDSVSFAYAWSADGKVVGSSQTLTAFKKGQSLTCAVTPRDGAASGEPVTTSAVVAKNTPPKLDGAAISPSAATAETALTCKPGRASDPDGDAVTFDVSWTIDGSPSGVTGETFPAGKAKKNQTVACVVTPSDGETAGEAVKTEGVKIRNTPPALASAALTPTEVATDDALTCAPGDAKDADGDALSYTFGWTVGGSTVAGQTGKTLSGDHFAKGQSVVCAVTPKDDEEAGREVRTAAVVVKNTPPVMRAASVENTQPLVTDALKCVPGDASDVDGDTVAFAYAWTVDGRAVSTSQTLPAGTAKKDQEAICTVTPKDSQASGAPVATAAVRIRNSEPVLKGVRVTPAAPKTTDALTCTPGTASDADGDAVTFSYAWSVDGAKKGGNEPSLAARELRKGQSVVCTVTPSDGTASGAAVASDPVVVVNTPPVLADASISPSEPSTTDDLSCAAGKASDDDDDKVSFAYQWTVGGRVVGESSARLPASQHAKGQSVTCAVTPKDDESSGRAVVSAAVKIANTPPVLSAAKLSPAEAYTNDTITCTPGESSDDDGDRVSFAFEWRVEGAKVAATGSTLSGSYFDRDQKVSCTVTPKDGTTDGAPVEAPAVVVRNTAPVLTTVDVGPKLAYTTTELTCTPGSASDVDKDPVSFKYLWIVDGKKLPASEPKLPAGSFAKNQQVRCAVIPTDGTTDGAPVESPVVQIVNSPPVIDAVVLGPESVYTKDTINARVDAHDVDGDPVNLKYTWFVDGKKVEGQSLPSLSGEAHFNRDQKVVVEVGANDTFVEGKAMRSEPLTVKNTPPTAVSVYINDPDGGFFDITCHVKGESTDIDGDPVSYRFEYTVNGQPFTGSANTTKHPGDTIPSSAMNTDDLWVCKGTPTDGTDDGPSSDFRVVIIRGDAGGGSSHSCSLSTLGQISCWGLDDYKVATPPEGDAYRRLAPGGWHNCALSAEGEIKCWGHKTYGQVTPPAGKWKEVTSGWWHSCALSAAGEVKCWGQSAEGRTTAPSGRYMAVDAGGQHTCAVTTEGALKCWGDDKFGQASPPAGSFRAVSSGENHSCALETSGAVRCWGSDDSGQLQVPAGSFVQLAAAARHNCALAAEDRHVVCWGLDNYGQLEPPAGPFRMVGKAFGHTCGMDMKGSVVCWGKNNYQQADVPAWLVRQDEVTDAPDRPEPKE